MAAGTRWHRTARSGEQPCATSPHPASQTQRPDQRLYFVFAFRQCPPLPRPTAALDSATTATSEASATPPSPQTATTLHTLHGSPVHRLPRHWGALWFLPLVQTTPGVVPRSARSSTAAAPEPPRPSLRPGLPGDDPLCRLEQEQQGTRTTSYTEKENLERDSIACPPTRLRK